mgnify:CR=1 FL=1
MRVITTYYSLFVCLLFHSPSRSPCEKSSTGSCLGGGGHGERNRRAREPDDPLADHPGQAKLPRNLAAEHAGHEQRAEREDDEGVHRLPQLSGLGEHLVRGLDHAGVDLVGALTGDEVDHLLDDLHVAHLQHALGDGAGAVLAADRGAAGVVISNPGGRQLEGAPTTFPLIAPVADAVGDRLEVLVDGGAELVRFEADAG